MTLKHLVETQMKELKQMIDKRKEELFQQIDLECHESTQLMRSMLNQGNETKELVKEFSNISQMNGYQLLEKKVNLLKTAINNYETMVNQVKNIDIKSLHNIFVENIEKEDAFVKVKNDLSTLGNVKKSVVTDSSWKFEYSKTEILDFPNHVNGWKLYRITHSNFNFRNFSYKLKIHSFEKTNNSWDPLRKGDIVEVIYSKRSLYFNVNGKGAKLAFKEILDVDYQPAVSIAAGKDIRLELVTQ
nr:unnamed protein product [Naegleria fowleri]